MVPADSTQNNQQALCRYCGHVRHQQRRDCPAYGKECRSCGLKNHFAQVCLSKNSSKPKVSHERYNQRETQRHSINRVENDGQIASKSDSNTSISSQRSVVISGDEIDDYMRHKEAIKYQINRLDGNTTKSVVVKASINKNQPVDFIIDTGSALTIISESTFNFLKEQPLLNPFSLVYKGFKSDNEIPFLGEFECDINVGSQSVRTFVQVVQGLCENLLGLHATEKLNLVRWNLVRQVKHSNHTRDLDKLKLIFPNTFSEKLGCIKSIEYKLEVDNEIKPVKQPLRPIAIHLREAVGEEIQKQV